MPAMEDHDASHRPLTGIGVLDLSRYLPGPFCTLQLAWLGADVTCLEQPPHGDPLRAMPPLGPDGTSLAYASLRRAARSELIDLADPEGLSRARQLAAECDVLVESFRPGVAERLGMGAEELRARNPRLVYCSISGYGRQGPWAQAPGHDLGYEAVAGLLAGDGPPTLPAVPFADLAGGQSAATAICAALVRRERTGAGCHLDIALSEAALALQAMHLPGGSSGEPEPGADMLTGGLASYDTYRCADAQWLAVAPIEPKFFATLCAALDRPDLAELQFDPQAQPQLRDELERIFATRTAAEWEQLLVGDDGGGCCVVRVERRDGVPRHPQLQARGALGRLPGSERHWMPMSPYVVDGTRSDEDASPG